ncbi:unnamed protein product [Rotaria sp. Silwood1]|nr:unnamed protein product [Rotaria sp. Silwood1]CAF0963159.1 unnamed protein product [Rotaria sp. Silwood1]CAF3411099.1 unnamed protein product [Rotaria sp. Silwood1]CAF4604106.1 unnamed protein product [Rotaria sp. Silwood1]
MATKRYQLAQPTSSDDNFYNLTSTKNQFNGTVIDLRQYPQPEYYSPVNDNLQQTSIVSRAQQQITPNSIEKFNNNRHAAQGIRASRIVEQPSPPQTHHRSSNKNLHSSTTDPFNYWCCICCCDCTGDNSSSREHDSCCDSDGCECCSSDCCSSDCCSCDCGSCDCSGCDCSGCDCSGCF